MGSFIFNWYVNIKYKIIEDKLEVYKFLFLNLCFMYSGIFVNIIIILICCNYFFFLQMNYYLERIFYIVEF